MNDEAQQTGSEPPPRTGLLVSVGGSPEPIAYSINRHEPACVLFFASSESRKQIEQEIRPRCTHTWQDQEIITTHEPEDLVGCLATLRAGVREALANLELAFEHLTVDYTGGTKTMSAALVLATIREPVRYSYIGGTRRNRNNLGTVETGAEALVYSPNPWDVLALDSGRDIARMFEQARYEEASAEAARAKARVGEHLRPLFVALEGISSGFALWDRYDYATAYSRLNSAYARLEQYALASNHPGLRRWRDQLEPERRRLEALSRAAKDPASESPDAGALNPLVLDLLASARRTAEKYSRYDDAVARLYSALEKIGKLALSGHGIDNSAARPEAIPPALREEYQARYQDSDGLLRFGLHATYRLLAALGDSLGQRYLEREAEFRKVLDIRNSSLLVHGWNPVREDTFQRLYALTLELAGLTPEEVPATPPCPEL